MTKEEINEYSYRVTQASKTELIVIMYEMTGKYMRDAVFAYDVEDFELYRENLKKAQRVINKLSAALDMNIRISKDLFGLYLYMNNTIVKASIRKDKEELEMVMLMIEKLGSAFKKVSIEDCSGPVMKNTQQVYAGLTYSNDGLNEYHDNSLKRGFSV